MLDILFGNVRPNPDRKGYDRNNDCIEEDIL